MIGATAASWRFALPVLLAAAAAPIAAAIWWLEAGPTRHATLGWLLYFGMVPVVLLALATCLVRLTAAASVGVWLSRNALGIVVASLLVVTVGLVVTPELRMQFDETSIVGVSQNMQAQRLAVMTTASMPFDGELVPLHNMVDKRPTLFAFCVSLLHDLRGYRVENAFVVNAGLLWFALVMVSAAARRRLGRLAAVVAPLLLMAVPMTTVAATSAGFELLATALLLATVLACDDLCERPDEPRALLVVGLSLLLAMARYESVLAVPVLLAVAAPRLWRRFRPTRRVVVVAAVAIALLLPLGPLLLHGRDPDFTPEAGGAALLSFGHFVDHLGPLLASLAAPGFDRPLVWPLGALAVVVWLVRLVKRQATRLDLLAIAPVLALTALMLAWFYGDVAEVTALRLFLPASWLVALAPLAGFASGRWFGWVSLPAAAAAAALAVHGVAVRSVYPQLEVARLTNALDSVVARFGADGGAGSPPSLWIGCAAQHLIVHGHAAMSVRAFQQVAREVAMARRRGDVGAVYLVETPLDGAMAPAFGAPRELLSVYPAAVVERVGGSMPITVHRLAR